MAQQIDARVEGGCKFLLLWVFWGERFVIVSQPMAIVYIVSMTVDNIMRELGIESVIRRYSFVCSILLKSYNIKIEELGNLEKTRLPSGERNQLLDSA